MPTLTKPPSLSAPVVHRPVPLHHLWLQLPALVREPLLCLLSRLLARQLPDALSTKEKENVRKASSRSPGGIQRNGALRMKRKSPMRPKKKKG